MQQNGRGRALFNPKKMRDFILKVGEKESEFGRNIVIRGRSSLEAGLNIVLNNTIPRGYVAHSLIDPTFEADKKKGLHPSRQSA